MPYRPRKQCREVNCPGFAVAGSDYCEIHKRGKRSGTQGVYQTKTWQKFRRSYLRQHPICSKCGEPSYIPHHIIPIAEGGPVYDEDNLMAVCFDCHEKIHGRRNVDIKIR